MKEIENTLFYSDCPATPVLHTGKLEEKQFNRSVTIYVTHKCNLRCKTCYINAGKPLKEEMGIKDYVNIFEQLKNMEFQMVYLLGGEPLLHKNIFEIISLGIKNGLYISMSSNGYFITEKVAEKLKASGLNQIQISLDAHDEEINDTIRGKGSFKKAVESINFLKNAGMKVSIAYTITSFNNDIESMIKFTEKLNVDLLNISIAEPFGRATIYNSVPTRNQVREVIEKLKNIETDLKITFNGFRFYLEENELKGIKKIENYTNCPAGKERFVIDSNGNVFGCELLMYKEFLEGNVKENRLREIWENGFSIFRNRKIPEECKNCFLKYECQGGCPARAFSLNGSIYRKDGLCKI